MEAAEKVMEETDPYLLTLSLDLGGNSLKSFEVAKRIVSVRPKSDVAVPKAYNYIGLFLQGQGKMDEAIDAFRKAIELNPRLALVHDNLANALSGQDKKDDADSEYRKAIEIDPLDPEAHIYLGLFWSEQGKINEATAEFRKATELDPTNADYRNGFGILLKNHGALDDAIAEYRKAIELDPADPRPHNNWANIPTRSKQNRRSYRGVPKGDRA